METVFISKECLGININHGDIVCLFFRRDRFITHTKCSDYMYSSNFIQLRSKVLSSYVKKMEPKPSVSIPSINIGIYEAYIKLLRREI